MRNFIVLITLCFPLFGCISQHDIRGVAEVDRILVVEGHITDYESVITLSRSRRLSNDDWIMDYIFYANVFVEREDGTLFPAESPITVWPPIPRFVVSNGKLDANSRYRLRIEMGNTQYFSEFSYPIITPEIDSIFWTTRETIDQWGFPYRTIRIHVATHSPDREVMFYRWSFREDWEVHSLIRLDGFPYRCWGFENSREMQFGSAERTIDGKVIHPIREISRIDRILSVLYRIEVTQNAISRRAHYYFENLQRNVELTGSIFSPTPSTIRGNIYNATDPNRHVIGFIDVSTTTRNRLYIPRSDGAYQGTPRRCVQQIGRIADKAWRLHDLVILERFDGGTCPYDCRDCVPCSRCFLCGSCGGCRSCWECEAIRWEECAYCGLCDICHYVCACKIRYYDLVCVDCTHPHFGRTTTEKPYDWPI